MVDVILGLQWGDEGKGKIVDYFAPNYDIVARFQGGPNAGHTLYVNGTKVVLHQIPSGIFQPNIINLIGGGVVLDPITFKKECGKVIEQNIDVKKNLLISERTNIIIPTHRALDKASEIMKGKDKIGSTQKGIGPAYMDKTGRNALRIGDILTEDFKESYEKLKNKHIALLGAHYDQAAILEDEISFFEAINYIKEFKIVAGEYFINDALNDGKKILAEGAQGSMLDIDFGTFPYVTSSNTITAGVCSGLGIAPQKINKIFGITKAYCTRVGEGPFPTELFDTDGENLRKWGNEFGSTTGRPRRCGWIDLIALKYTCMINGITDLIMTKIDILDQLDEVKVCTGYQGQTNKQHVPFKMDMNILSAEYLSFNGWKENISHIINPDELPEKMKTYIEYIDKFIGIKTKYLSHGPNREQIIIR